MKSLIKHILREETDEITKIERVVYPLWDRFGGIDYHILNMILGNRNPNQYEIYGRLLFDYLDEHSDVDLFRWFYVTGEMKKNTCHIYFRITSMYVYEASTGYLSVEFEVDVTKSYVTLENGLNISLEEYVSVDRERRKKSMEKIIIDNLNRKLKQENHNIKIEDSFTFLIKNPGPYKADPIN